MEVAFVFVALFIIIFGIFYLHFSTRNKERLALIEKGADASIFFSPKSPKEKSQGKSSSIGKIILLNFSVLLIGTSLGIFFGAFLEANTTLAEGVAYSGSILLFAGIGLLVGFLLTKKLIEDKK